jgi:hypothetical protein
MKRLAKQLVAEAAQLGYVHDRTNSNGYHVYVHPSGHEVQICPSAAEHQARAITKAMRRTAGTWQPTNGRNAQAVKERAGRRRHLDAERLAARRRQVQAEHDAYLARIARAPHLNDDPAALRRIEAYLRELADLDALMRSIPARDGRVKHTAGARAT